MRLRGLGFEFIGDISILSCLDFINFANAFDYKTHFSLDPWGNSVKLCNADSSFLERSIYFHR